jgi:hypothetical protein
MPFANLRRNVLIVSLLTLLQSGDIPPNRTFDPNVFTDVSYWEESHPEPVLTGTIPAPRPPQ